jgi:hypothetical protein
LKNVQVGQKSLCKVGAKEGMAAEKIRTMIKEPITLHWDNRKDALRTLQELARLYPLQA